MGTLYGVNSYSTLAVYENGVVYDDSRKISVLGTYSGGSVYLGSGIYSKYVGSYIGERIKGTGYLATTEGYISGNTVYSGSNSVYSTRVATFNGDSEGAAAAALLCGVLNGVAGTSGINDDSTYSSYGYSGSYGSDTSTFSIFFFLFCVLVVLPVFVIDILDGSIDALPMILKWAGNGISNVFISMFKSIGIFFATAWNNATNFLSNVAPVYYIQVIILTITIYIGIKLWNED